MRKIILTLIFSVVSFGLSAHYTIHSFTEGVKVETGGKSVPASKGLSVKASDYVVIPKGGKVEIFNDLDKRVYTSINPGKISVTRLMIDARGAASDHNSNVISQLRLGKNNSGNNKNIYVEKGLVRRSLAVYDPEADNVEMDGATLGGYIAEVIRKGDINGGESPVSLESGRLAEGGIGFSVENTLAYPVYFNIIKLDNDSGPHVEISCLGQPAGSYVVLPRQTLSRQHLPALQSDERHLLIMTRCQYDIDEVIDRINESLAGPAVDNSYGDLPIYFKEL